MFYWTFYQIKIKEFVTKRALSQKGSSLHTYCSNDVTYFMCSDLSKMEMKILSERLPFGKKTQKIFENKVCFISNKW